MKPLEKTLVTPLENKLTHKLKFQCTKCVLKTHLSDQLYYQLRDQLKVQLSYRPYCQLEDRLMNRLWYQLRVQLKNRLSD